MQHLLLDGGEATEKGVPQDEGKQGVNKAINKQTSMQDNQEDELGSSESGHVKHPRHGARNDDSNIEAIEEFDEYKL